MYITFLAKLINSKKMAADTPTLLGRGDVRQWLALLRDPEAGS